MAPSILGRLREYVGDRRRGAPRRHARFAARVPAEAAPLDRGSADEGRGVASVTGVTRDVGAGGLTLMLDGIRAGGRYLTESDCHLGVRLGLPAGEVFLLTRVVRFEQPAEGGGQGYLFAVRILEAREGDRAAYYDFLRGLEPSERRAGERVKARAGLATGDVTRWEDVAGAELRDAFEAFVGTGSTR
jgi:hypothetical protein